MHYLSISPRALRRALPGVGWEAPVRSLKGRHLDLGPDLAEGDGDAIGAHARHAVLGDVGAVAVEDEDRAEGQGALKGRGELALVDDLDVGAKEDRLLREEREGDKGAREVEVVNMRRDAVALRVPVEGAGTSE